MKLIVGLGNPGEKYENTRHNLGFDVVESFLQDFEPEKKTNWTTKKDFKSDIATIDWNQQDGEVERVILARPLTFMNHSGMAVQLITSYYKIEPSDLWVIHDELDLPVGSLKIRLGGSGAGHHGIESIIESIGTDKFWRFRMGIGVSHNHGEVAEHRGRDVSDFVLDRFEHGEVGKVRELIKRTQKALSCALEEGLDAAMNKYNTK